MGMAISQEIIAAHSGEINVFSNSDQTNGPRGTVFVVKLPAASN